ncbi:hypothetical protein D9757_001937 [Collybiopsis confluens]|uniref:Uncharacterized protein n=1 Tax=Collybiopsis confluens TaxID=2823264 RepID=A0A8H5HXT1_9AGAR|nr:hypothetical protein D9757_001937 [Collybiopsis confluens]
MEEQTLIEANYQEWHAKWSRMKTTMDRWESHSKQFPFSAAQKVKLQQFKAQCDEAFVRLETAYNRRVERGNSSLNLILTAIEKQDLKAVELQKLSTEVTQKIAEVEALKKQRETTLNVDSNVSSAPSHKRRRLSGPEAPSHLVTQTNEITGLHRSLKSVAERLSTVQNNVIAQETEVQEMLRAYMQDRAQAEAAGESRTESRVNEIYDQVDRVADEFSEVSEWIAEIINDSSRNEAQLLLLSDASEQQELETRNLLTRVKEHEEQRSRDQSEIDALSATLNLYRDRPVSPPSSPFDPESFVGDMKDLITELVHEAVKSEVEEVRSALAEDLQKHNSELYSTLWSKLSLTTKVIAAVSEATKEVLPVVPPSVS